MHFLMFENLIKIIIKYHNLILSFGVSYFG